ncbi:hypothetical protein H310_10144 [Aphanomyces invadans]|uniref:Fanconi anemia group D2 protein n=2 Tax=Aphanomyces invadans TaxID=157072 RepID=A0A024TRU6_9STRA|nr:hypothetical protein H310_10144 [Aphanomyces invadans]ETV96860.1 hypothetical protein H310_10144 [Aphanomyces invadans]|eukprot:XP_008874638.1 hypothetical protein H310_10144 [Aphanomyces invadans]
MTKKRKRANASGIVAAWELFWDAIEDVSMEVPDPDHLISMFKAEPRDQDVVVVERALSMQPVDTVLHDLEALFSDTLELQRMLTSFSEKDSFMRILLRNETIQTPLVNLLMELLSELAQKASEEVVGAGASITNSVMPSSGLCSLILRHIRWIECVFDPSALTEKLLTSLSTYPLFLQKDIIHILPELVSDRDFQLAVDTLLETIGSENELVVPAIEALSNFNMPAEISDEVTSCILGRLTSSSLEDMPALLRFLVQTMTESTASSMLNTIREKVSDCIKASSDARMDSSQDESFLLQQFVHGMIYRTDLLDHFLKLLAKTSTGNGYIMDVWCLVGFHSSLAGPMKAKIEAIFVKKVAQGNFSREVLVESLGHHLRGLTPYLSSVVLVTGALLQSPDVTDQGRFVFSLLFNELSKAREPLYEFQTQIISDLVDFAMSSVTSTVDSALATLLAIATHEPQRLDKYLSLLKHLLDCIERFNVDQCRQVYQLLYRVGGSGNADLSITVRKQLYHLDNQYRKLGMIGYVCCIEAEVDAMGDDGTPGLDESEVNPARDQFEKKIRDRLDILRDACRKQAKALSFMYAELNHFVNRMDSRRHPNVVAIFDEKFSEVLMNEFLPIFDARIHQQGGYKRPVFNGAFHCDQWAITRMNSPVFLQIMTLVASQDTMERPLYLYSLLNLVVSCYKQSDTLENIGTVLICPILLMEKNAIANLGTMEKDAQDGVFLALWHGVNWCRELLNCFSSDVSLAGKVLTRLENAVELESILEDAIMNAPTSVWLPQGIEIVTGTCTTDATFGRRQSSESTKKTDPKSKGKAATHVQQRLATIRSSFTPLNSRVVGVLPRMKDSIDPRSFHFLLDHFLRVLRKSLVKTYTTAPHWAAKHAPVTTHSNPSLLVHSGFVDLAPGFAMFETYLKFHLLNVANNFRWVLDAVEPPPTPILHALTSKYIQSIVVIAKADAVFEQHNQQRLQLMALQQLILPVEQHVQVDVVDQSATVLGAMSDALLSLQTVPCMDIDIAVHLVTALVALERLKVKWNGLQNKAILFSPPRGPVSPLAELALGYLRRDWSTQAADKAFSYKTADLTTLLDTYFEFSPHPLDSVQDVACCGFVNLLENYNANVSNEYFPTLSKKTMGVFVRASIETVVRATSRLDYSDDAPSNPAHLLHYLHQASLLFKLLVGLTRSFHTSMVVAAVLKHGTGFVQNILRAMPYFERHFVGHSTRILATFKEVQGGTRRLQVLCAHGKLIQDASAAAQVPKLKRLLERLIYETSKLAREHNFMDAFSTGILKQRNLDGSAAQPDDDGSSDNDEDGDETEAENTEIDDDDGEEE